MRSILRIGLIGFILIGVNFGYGQDSTRTKKSVVIMSESEISSLAAILKKYKNQNSTLVKLETKPKAVTENKNSEKKSITNSNFEADYLRKKIALLETEIGKKTVEKNTNKNKNAENNVLKDTDELNNLKSELEIIKLHLANLAIQNSETNKPTVITVPEPKVIENPAKILVQAPINNNENLLKRIDSLTQLLTNFENEKDTSFVSEFKAMEAKLLEIKNQIKLKNEAETKQPSSTNFLASYTKKIYFENNSTSLKLKDGILIGEITSILAAHKNADVYIKGFASKKGSVSYNEQLSMFRTEVVKKALINNGVHPTRVLTQYHGIDYSAKSDDEARRVEIEFFIRD